jgi:flagellar basal-body rod modification protein FlgD
MTVAAAASTTVTNPLQTYIANQQATTAAATAASAASSSDPTSASAIAGNFNTFIKILTTQLQNQDPTSATDTNQFTSELVQFAQVEQQLNTNSDLNKLYNLQSASSLATGSGYIGSYVESSTTTNQFALQSGVSEFGYTLASTAQNVTVAITDANNNVVASYTGNGTAGKNYVSWNGLETNGTQAPDGNYTFAVTATDQTGDAIAVSSPVVLSKVTGVATNSDGTLTLNAGALSVSSSTVDALYSKATLPTATSLTGTATASTTTSTGS